MTDLDARFRKAERALQDYFERIRDVCPDSDTIHVTAAATLLLAGIVDEEHGSFTEDDLSKAILDLLSWLVEYDGRWRGAVARGASGGLYLLLNTSDIAPPEESIPPTETLQ